MKLKMTVYKSKFWSSFYQYFKRWIGMLYYFIGARNHIRYTCINFHSFVLFGSKMTTGMILFLQSNQSVSSKIPFTFFVIF